MRRLLVFILFLLIAARSQGQIFMNIDSDSTFVGAAANFHARLSGNAVNPVFEMTTPPRTTFVSVTPPEGWTCQTPQPGGVGQISCTGPSFLLVLGPFLSLRFNLRIDPDYEYYTALTTRATLRAENAAPITRETFDIVDPLYDASLDKSIASHRNGVITFALRVTNPGPSFARHLIVRDDLPPSLGFLSIEAPGWDCSTPPQGQTGLVSCTHPQFPLMEQTLFLSTSVLQSGEGSNTASLGNTSPDFFQSDNTDTVTFGAGLLEVPALDTLGLMLLGFGLAAAALLRMRKTRATG